MTKILFVDRSEGTQHYTVAALSSEYTVVPVSAVSFAESALSRLPNEFALAVIHESLYTPGDGLKLARKIRSELRDIKVVILYDITFKPEPGITYLRFLDWDVDTMLETVKKVLKPKSDST